MAMAWNPDADIRDSFAMNFKKMSLLLVSIDGKVLVSAQQAIVQG